MICDLRLLLITGIEMQDSQTDTFSMTMRNILLILALLTIGFTRAFAQSTIPPELRVLADQALDVACKKKAAARFDSIMAELGKKVDVKTFNDLLPQEGQSLQAKVIVVAYYRAIHGEMYDNIMDAF